MPLKSSVTTHVKVLPLAIGVINFVMPLIHHPPAFAELSGCSQFFLPEYRY